MAPGRELPHSFESPRPTFGTPFMCGSAATSIGPDRQCSSETTRCSQRAKTSDEVSADATSHGSSFPPIFISIKSTDSTNALATM